MRIMTAWSVITSFDTETTPGAVVARELAPPIPASAIVTAAAAAARTIATRRFTRRRRRTASRTPVLNVSSHWAEVVVLARLRERDPHHVAASRLDERRHSLQPLDLEDVRELAAVHDREDDRTGRHLL